MVLRWLFVLALYCVSCTLWAGALQIAPVKILLTPKHLVETLKITNQDKNSVLLQLDAKSWQQNQEGQDVYDPTLDLLVTPSVFTIPAGQSQIVRLAVLKPEKLFSNPKETAYRMVMREILTQTEASGNQLNMAIQTLIPVFVRNDPSRHAFISDKVPDSAISTAIDTTKDYPSIKVENKGSHYFLVTGLSVFDQENQLIIEKKKLFTYLLSGSSKIISLDTDKHIPQNAKIVLDLSS